MSVFVYDISYQSRGHQMPAVESVKSQSIWVAEAVNLD